MMTMMMMHARKIKKILMMMMMIMMGLGKLENMRMKAKCTFRNSSKKLLDEVDKDDNIRAPNS